MRRYLLPVVFFALSANVFGQSRFDVLADDPNFATFMGQIGIGLETDFSLRTEVPVTLQFHYDFNTKPVEVDASFMVSFLGDRKGSFYPDNLTDNEYQNYNSFEAGGVYNFFDKTELKSIRVVVGRSTKTKVNYTLKTEYYVRRDGHVRKRFGVRAGLYRYAQSITDYDAYQQSLNFADGTKLPDADNPWTEKPSDNDHFYFTAERHLATYLGLCYHRSYGMVLDNGPKGKRYARANVSIFADAFIDVASDVQKIGYQGQLYDLKEATSGVDLNNMGFRVGAKRADAIMFYSLEVGMRPQYLKTQFYAQLLIGYSFNRHF